MTQVQVPDKVIIYDLEKGDDADMNYRVKDRIMQRIDCNLLVITAEHLILCYVSLLHINYTLKIAFNCGHLGN